MRQANFLFHMAFHIQKRKLACRTLYMRVEDDNYLVSSDQNDIKVMGKGKEKDMYSELIS
jgi:hypothetical protein